MEPAVRQAPRGELYTNWKADYDAAPTTRAKYQIWSECSGEYWSPHNNVPLIIRKVGQIQLSAQSQIDGAEKNGNSLGDGESTHGKAFMAVILGGPATVAWRGVRSVVRICLSPITIPFNAWKGSHYGIENNTKEHCKRVFAEVVDLGVSLLALVIVASKVFSPNSFRNTTEKLVNYYLGRADQRNRFDLNAKNNIDTYDLKAQLATINRKLEALHSRGGDTAVLIRQKREVLGKLDNLGGQIELNFPRGEHAINVPPPAYVPGPEVPQPGAGQEVQRAALQVPLHLAPQGQ